MLPQIQITGHGIEVTEVLRDFINDKFGRLTKHAHQIISVHIILNVEKLRQIAEAKILIPQNEIYAQAESEDMYKTIDFLLDKVVRQLDKIRSKNGNH